MTTSPDFVKLARPYSFPTSTDDFSVTDSDMGSSPSRTDMEQNNSIDYWFGKKYLECIVAETFLHATMPGDTFSAFDVKVNVCLGSYPYGQCWSFVQSLGLGIGAVRSGSSDHACIENLLTAIGTTIRTGSAAEKKTMLSKLRDMCESTNRTRSESATNSGPKPMAGDDPHKARGTGMRVDSFVSNETRDPSMYSMALKEHGDLVGVLPDYHILPSRSNSPGWEATLQFCGVMGRGIGKSRKAAQHMAAKEACNALEIDPWS